MASKTTFIARKTHGSIDGLVGRNVACFRFFPRITKTSIVSLLVLSLWLSATPTPTANEEVQKGSANVNIFDSEEDLEVSLAKYIADLSNKSVIDRRVFTLVLTGDSLINSMSLLLEAPYLNQLDWSKWYIFWADERMVSKTNPLSNYKLDNDDFLSKVPIPKDHIISINDKLTTEDAAADYEARLKQLVQSGVIATSNATGFPRFDLILLGLGYNGHVASLFPNRPQLSEQTRWVTYIKDSPKPPTERITMTFPVINSASNVAFVVTGQDKAKVVSQVLDGNQTQQELPAKTVSPKAGSLKWFLDKGSSFMLKLN